MPIGEPIYYPDVQSDIDMKGTYKLTNYPASSTAILSIDKTIYVDATNGTSSGQRGTTAAFQTLAQALAVSLAGDAIVFRPSTTSTPHLVVPQTISLNGISIFAYGAYIRVTTTTASPIITLNACDRFSWYGGEIDGQRGGSAIANGGFVTIGSGATNTLIDSAYIHGFSSAAQTMVIGQSNHTTLNKVRFEDNFCCVQSDTGGTTGSAWYDLNITGCSFRNGYSSANGTGAIKLHSNCGAYKAGWNITNFIIDSAGQIGIENQGGGGVSGANDGVIGAGRIYGTSFGISIDSVQRVSVSNVNVKGCGIGLEVANAAAFIEYTNVTVDGRDLSGVSVSADLVSGSGSGPNNISFSDCTLLYGTGSPIHFQNVSNSVVKGGSITGSTTLINLAASTRNKIVNVDLHQTSSSAQAIVFIDSTSADCTDNVIESNRFFTAGGTIAAGGVQLYSTGAHNVLRTSFVNNWTDGLTAYTGGFIQITGGSPTYRRIGNYTAIADQSNEQLAFGLDKYFGVDPVNGVTRLAAYRTDYISQIFKGNGDGLTLAGGNYNVGIKSANQAIGFTRDDNTLKGLYDTYNGIWDVAGGYKVNGTSVELPSNKGIAGGYASLDVSGKVPAAQLPTLSSGTIATTPAILKGDNSGNAIASTPTGTGDNVLATSPTLITPTIGVATATSLNKWVFTAPSTAATVTAGADNLTYSMPEITTLIGFRHIPQNSKSTSYTTVLNDSGKNIYHPVVDNNARTFTIDSNANVAYPIGTGMMFTNMAAAALTVAITSDTLTLLGTGTTGSRTIAQYGRLYIEKDTATSWLGIPIANVT